MYTDNLKFYNKKTFAGIFFYLRSIIGIGGVFMNNNENYDKKGFYMVLYTLAAVFLLIAFGISILNSGGGSDDGNVNLEEEIAPVDKSNVEKLTTEVTSEMTTIDTAEAQTEAITRRALENTPAAAASESADLTLFDDSQEMVWPVSGQIVMDYSVETGIFDRTLEQYRTNDSICISAPMGTDVVAAADGTVAAITKDNVDGITVELDHGNGWKTTYSQLQENLAVSEGQAVYKGDIIGKIAKPTGYSSALDCHLDFSVFKDDVATDPKLILAQLDE